MKAKFSLNIFVFIIIIITGRVAMNRRSKSKMNLLDKQANMQEAEEEEEE